MFSLSYRVVAGGLFAMIAASVLLFFDTLPWVAYIGLIAGFFMIGIGILIGFYQMIRDDESS